MNDMARESEERAEAQRMSQEFWNTRFCRKYSTFGSEPRGKVSRQADGTRIDDGYTQWGYAKKWNQKDKQINATNPRVMLAETFGVLLNGPPGPGEYSKVTHGINVSSKYKNRGNFTVKGKDKKSSNETSPTKIPIELLDFSSKKKDRLENSTIQKRKNSSTMASGIGGKSNSQKMGSNDVNHQFLCGTKVNGKPIEYLSDEQLRQEIYKQGSDPGPNNYPNADTPYYLGKVGRRNWNSKGPEWSIHSPIGKPREMINFNNIFVPLKTTKTAPGPGTYNLYTITGRDAPKCPISPIPQLSLKSSKLQSPVGPGSYDISASFEATTRMNKVAKSYQQADMGRPAMKTKCVYN